MTKGEQKEAEKMSPQDREWYEADIAAWNAAAEKLVAAGYRQVKDRYWKAVFVKAGEPDLVLTRHLGKLDWSPRPRF